MRTLPSSPHTKPCGSRVPHWGSFFAILAVIAAHFAHAQGPIPAVIPHGPIQIDLQPVATGLIAPGLLLPAGDGSGRLFIVEQTGQVRILQGGSVAATPFLDVSSRLVSLTPGYDERGLLGVAFDPGFNDPLSAGYQRIFTYTSEVVSGAADFTVPLSSGSMDHQSVVASWRVDSGNPNQIDPTSRQEILRIDEPQFNHNGGMLAFGPDNYLYIAVGDGGAANDSGNGHNAAIGNAQDETTVLGKILRIDVNGTDSANGQYGIPSDNPFASGAGVDEIFATGFRNPYRFSFNGSDGLLVADVGQDNIEELDRVEIGQNYGWRYKEGTFKFNLDGSVTSDLTGVPSGLTDPILQYDHDEGISIIGGFVYTGSLVPELTGKYVFGDFSQGFAGPNGRLFYADLSTGDISEFILGDLDQPLGLFVKGLGRDENGEIYVLGSTDLGPSGTNGVVLQIVPEPAVGALALFAGLLFFIARSTRNRAH